MTVKLALNDHDYQVLTEKTGIDFTMAKQNGVRAIRLSTIDAICEALGCEPGDVFVFSEEAKEDQAPSLSGSRS